MQQAVESRRRDDERRIRRLSEDGGALMARGSVDERARHETQPLQRFAVAAQSRLVLGAALHVLVDETGDAPPCDGAQIGDVERAGDVAAAERMPFPGHARSACHAYLTGATPRRSVPRQTCW